MFQATLRSLIQSNLIPGYYSEDYIDKVVDYSEAFSSYPAYPAIFIGLDEDLDLFKGWILTQSGMKAIPIHHVSSTASSEFKHLLQKNKAVIYFIKK